MSVSGASLPTVARARIRQAQPDPARRPPALRRPASALLDLRLDRPVRRRPGGACRGRARPHRVRRRSTAQPRRGRAQAPSARRVPELPPLRVGIEKRIPVAAGLGGGSADAAAVLRAANRIAGDPLDAAALRELGAELGSDVPSQVEPRHAAREWRRRGGRPDRPAGVRRRARASATWACRPPTCTPSSTASVAVGAKSIRVALRALAREMVLLPVLGNDLQPAALALRPELAGVLGSLRASGALGALVSGSGPTCFGLFEDRGGRRGRRRANRGCAGHRAARRLTA